MILINYPLRDCLILVAKLICTTLIVFFVGYIGSAHAQQSVSGTVRDANGGPVSGATVSVSGGDDQQQTDTQGRFTFSSIPPNATLVVTYVGADPVEYPVQGRTTVEITLGKAILLTTAFSILIFGLTGYLTWMLTYLYENFSLSLSEAGFHSMFYTHIFAFVGIIIAGRLSDRLALTDKRKRLLLQSAGLMLASPFIYSWAIQPPY